MKPRGPRKPRTIKSRPSIKPIGTPATKNRDRIASIAAQRDRERQRHWTKAHALAAQSDAAHGIVDPALRQMELIRLRAEVKEENDRYRFRLAEFERRMRAARS